jgi:hypothetical protein
VEGRGEGRGEGVGAVLQGVQREQRVHNAQPGVGVWFRVRQKRGQGAKALLAVEVIMAFQGAAFVREQGTTSVGVKWLWCKDERGERKAESRGGGGSSRRDCRGRRDRPDSSPAPA